LPVDPVPAPPAEVPPTALSADLDDSGFADAGDEMFAISEREPEVSGIEDAGDEMFAVPEREPEDSGFAEASDEMFAIPEREPEVSGVAEAGDEMFAIPEREPEVSGAAEAGDEMLAIPESEPEDSFALVDPSSTSEEAFDFTFDSEPVAAEPVAAEPALAEDPMPVEAEDLAQATVLDPNGAAGYDVSSSDLGDPFAAEPLGEASEPADATRLMDFPAAVDEPVAAAELTGVGDFGEDLAPAVFEPEEQPAAPARGFEPPATAEPAREFEPPATAEPAFEPPAAAPPAEAARPVPEEAAVRADSVLSEIAPTLRAEIHDTLEKVAWESFGDVTEKIVADAVDRVEKIAWEVIPQLAETLIKEEIRRLKGESDD
jgi:hypothetical protein